MDIDASILIPTKPESWIGRVQEAKQSEMKLDVCETNLESRGKGIWVCCSVVDLYSVDCGTLIELCNCHYKVQIYNACVILKMGFAFLKQDRKKYCIL